MPRARAPLTFGAGLDRSTGAGVRDARTLTDARNLIAREAGLGLRAGLAGTGFPALDWGTDILAMDGIEQTRDVLQVVYDRTSRDIRIYRVNPVSPATRQNVGTWGTLNASASFPVITMAEVGGRVFFAHAEPLMNYRLPTKYWAPGALDTDAGTLTTLTADLDTSGAAGDVYFYGVTRHREYLAGWGWGTETSAGTKDRPEIVRLSKPDDSTVLPADTYFICGARGSRIETCRTSTGGLLCFSAIDRYTVFGTDPENFGVDITDPSHGAVGPRAAVTVNGRVYAWGSQGPRVTEDAMAASEDLAVPLDLMQAVPSTWAAAGPAREMFMAYEPEQRVLYFAWPDLTSATATTTLAYLLSLRTPTSPRFTVAVFLRRLACAGRYIAGKITPPPGTGYATAMAAVDDGWIVATSGRRLSVSWTNTSALGNETADVWLKTGGTWAVQQSIAVSGSSQSTTITGLEALTDYEVAVRFRTPAGGYTTGYTEATPDLWTAGTAAGSKDTISTGATTPTLVSSDWTRTSSTTTVINLAGVIVDRRVDLVVEKNVNGAGWVTATTFTPPSTSWAYAYPVAVGDVDHSIQFRVRHLRGAAASSYSATRTRVAGFNPTNALLDTPFDVTSGEARPKASVRFLFVNPTNLDPENFQATHFQIEEVGAASVTMAAPPAHTVYGWTPIVESTVLTGTSGSINLRYRWGRTAYGVTDWGPWSGNGFPATVSGAAAPPAPDPAYWSGPDGTLDVATAFPVDFLALISSSASNYAWLVLVQDTSYSDAKLAVRGYPAVPNWGQPITITAPTEHGANGQPRLVISAYETYDPPGAALPILSAKMVNP